MYNDLRSVEFVQVYNDLRSVEFAQVYNDLRSVEFALVYNDRQVMCKHLLCIDEKKTQQTS